MSLAAMRRSGEIARLEPGTEEIANLLETARRRLADAQVPALSNESAFVLAYQCVLACATAALRAAGYRVPGDENKHLRTIDTLRFTLKLRPDEVKLLHKARKKRNEDLYEGSVEVSEEERDTLLEVAARILRATRAFLESKDLPV